jgi:hypothetical protein
MFLAKASPDLNGIPIFVVQYAGFFPRALRERRRLADEIIEKLVALGAKEIRRRVPREKES